MKQRGKSIIRFHTKEKKSIRGILKYFSDCIVGFLKTVNYYIPFELYSVWWNFVVQNL